ncbi:MAG TPA: metallophosphoesterase [Myxococcota bacterium]|nr:metallophosphoesterase [Myxococcota bacterium]HRY92174.1 metallophosphoesterase [Myxococcota bacterium]HSA22361.1 metallophosphoesterase [Myxococcota bacterium]
MLEPPDGDDGDAGCTPSCLDRVCGDDGCGGSCGACGAGEECAPDGQCLPACVPACQGHECGLDPACGTLDCGVCGQGLECSDQGRCLPACVPDCAGRACGGDGCGGSCGACDAGAGLVCVEVSGQCAACAPDCAGLECGLDPLCGAACGACPAGWVCTPDGQCDEQCAPDCWTFVCGLDPLCGSLDCGACPAGEECDGQGRCLPACSPDCQGRACGPDPLCGSLDCGACPADERCDASGQCGPACGDACEPFSIVLLPDTQYYTSKQAAGPNNTLFKQLRWVLDHRAERDIRFVIHLGDITNNNYRSQWEVADAAFDLLDAASMPYSIMPGNHDSRGANDSWARGNTLMNDPAFFPPSRYAGEPWYGGAYGGSSTNSYALFEAGPYKFMVISLEYGPRKGPLCWAEELIAAHPDRRVILVSHCIQTHGGGLNQSCPAADWLLIGGSGQTIWDELAARHSNVFLVLSGHINDSEYKLRHGLAGNPVHTILTDYQFEGVRGCKAGTYTGNGWIRELVFTPRENRVYARTFTVEDGNTTLFAGGEPALYCGDYSADPAAGAHQFHFDYDLSTAPLDERREGGRAFVDQTVNTDADGDQLQPVLAGREAGGFVAVWEDDSSTADGAGNFDVMMRGFEPGGCEAFGQRLASADGAGQQLAPAAGMAADGSFVVAWQDDTDANGSFQIHARGFTAGGAERFARLTVNAVDTGQQENPAVAVAPDGRFCVAWEDDRDRDGDMQIWLRGFAADGSQRFAERSVHADDAGNRQRPAVAALPDGGCVVVWEDDGDGNGAYQIHARGFGDDGGQRFARLTVNTQSAGQQKNPAVGADAGGGFVVAWEDDQDGDGNFQILARGFEAGGGQRFADRRVHEVAGGQHLRPALGVGAGGAFALAWQDDGDGNGTYQIRAAGFGASGAAGVAERTVNRIADGQQLAPGAALDGTGSLAVIWQDDMDGNDAFQLLARGLDGYLP